LGKKLHQKQALAIRKNRHGLLSQARVRLMALVDYGEETFGFFKTETEYKTFLAKEQFAGRCCPGQHHLYIVVKCTSLFVNQECNQNSFYLRLSLNKWYTI
jgi:hypothetical protein